MHTLKRLTTTITIMVTLGGGHVGLPPQPVQARTTCRGLNRAKNKRHVKLIWAKHHGYKRCKLG